MRSTKFVQDVVSIPYVRKSPYTESTSCNKLKGRYASCNSTVNHILSRDQDVVKYVTEEVVHYKDPPLHYDVHVGPSLRVTVLVVDESLLLLNILGY